MKSTGGARLSCYIENFPREATPLEKEWHKLSTTPTPPPSKKKISSQNLKHIHKLLLENIYDIKQLTRGNVTNLMSHTEYINYYKKPTHMLKYTLKIAEQLFCHPRCNENCQEPCQNHYPPRTLKQEYIITKHNIEPLNNDIHTHPQALTLLIHPSAPTHVINNSTKYPIHSIIDHYIVPTKDKHKI